MRFGRLTVVKRAEDYIEPSSGRHRARWLCDCDCGNETIVLDCNLTKKNGIKSCGCLRRNFAHNLNKKCNTYDLSGEYGIGYTSKGEEFYFDLEDYNAIKDYCWRISNKGYVVCSIHRGRNVPKRDMLMHILVMNGYDDNLEVNKSIEIDHIHGNTSRNDNRKLNLRICTHSENMMNVGLRSDNTSGVTGVTWHKGEKIWVARITIDGVRRLLGRYKKFEDAVKARKEAENEYYGEFSYDNSQSYIINNERN